MSTLAFLKKNTCLLLLVTSLGYFVDIYDLLVFLIVRVKSFHDIGVPARMVRTYGEYVLNMQMGGMLIGGLLWGILGDKIGRVRILFGSIILYSSANIANCLVQGIHSYAIVRFFSGVGLAGELGAGVTLVSESMSKETRSYGIMFMGFIGAFGTVLAAFIAEAFSWKTAYLVGGCLGFLLLFLRIGTHESKLFKEQTYKPSDAGNIHLLFLNKKRFLKYIRCILIGLPLWFIVGILVTQAPELGVALHTKEPVNASIGVVFAHCGIASGQIVAGLFSQFTKSRKLTVLVFQGVFVLSTCLYLGSYGMSNSKFYFVSFLLGLGGGYWMTFVTIAAEQFGTNIRSTVTNTVSNFARGSLIPITAVFEFFVKRFDIVSAAYITMFFVSAIALIALNGLEESFGKDLNYVESD